MDEDLKKKLFGPDSTVWFFPTSVIMHTYQVKMFLIEHGCTVLVRTTKDSTLCVITYPKLIPPIGVSRAETETLAVCTASLRALVFLEEKRLLREMSEVSA